MSKVQTLDRFTPQLSTKQCVSIDKSYVNLISIVKCLKYFLHFYGINTAGADVRIFHRASQYLAPDALTPGIARPSAVQVLSILKTHLSVSDAKGITLPGLCQWWEIMKNTKNIVLFPKNDLANKVKTTKWYHLEAFSIQDMTTSLKHPGILKWCYKMKWQAENFKIYLALLITKPKYSRLTASRPWLLLPWLLVSPGHQQPWYWLCRINRFFHKEGSQLPAPSEWWEGIDT